MLDLAARLELEATNANLGVITVFNDPTLDKIVARLPANEVGHFEPLNLDLKRPSSKAFAFGPCASQPWPQRAAIVAMAPHHRKTS